MAVDHGEDCIKVGHRLHEVWPRDAIGGNAEGVLGHLVDHGQSPRDGTQSDSAGETGVKSAILSQGRS